MKERRRTQTQRIRKATVRRVCLKCQTEFDSIDGDRLCQQCNKTNSKIHAKPGPDARTRRIDKVPAGDNS